ncbi:MAG: MFS transporter [Gammaproteobacteria bacterium]
MSKISQPRVTLALASIFAFRMLGLFMILPVFSIYAQQLPDATPKLIGLALGIYGLTQALLQIPFGLCSDRIGRRPVITLGLGLFAIGSLVAATAHTLVGIIIGRCLQGAGAIGSTTIALIADLTSEQNRTKAMAVVGMVVGLSFALAMVLGPLLNAWIGVSGIFLLTAILAITGIIILYTLIPVPSRQQRDHAVVPIPSLFKTVLTNPQLLRLDFGIFALHCMLTASFVAIPVALTHVAGFAISHQWLFYLPILGGSFILMIPFIIIAEKKQQMKPIFLLAIMALALAQLSLYYYHASIGSLVSSLMVFFFGFNLLEATLPSLISKISHPNSKGTALGIYSSSQFLGIFAGGVLGGWFYAHHQLNGVFLACAFLACIWLVVAANMRIPLASGAKHSEHQNLHF